MDTRKLEAFVAVAEELHFGRAAARLHLGQPHLGRTVRAFEGELGAELFRRTTRTVELTPSGAALLPHARALLTGTDQARAAVTAARTDAAAGSGSRSPGRGRTSCSGSSPVPSASSTR